MGFFYIRKNTVYFPMQNWIIGSYNRDNVFTARY
jgi:hypothetical protein